MKSALRMREWYAFIILDFINFNIFPKSMFVGAIAVGDLVKSTLGPKGMVR